MAIGLLKHLTIHRRFDRLADRPLDAADWPLGEPGDARTLGDLSERDHLVISVTSKTLLANLTGLRCKISALVFEPPVIQGRYYRLLRHLGGRYHRVLTHNNWLLERLPNARFLPHGGCWLKQGAVDKPHHPKTGLVALIASAKKGVGGHKLRHRVAEWSRTAAPHVELFGKAFRPLDDKGQGHSPFYYSVVIENSREPGYFTEKVLDSLLCMSLPIYWGAPDIAHFLDPRGLVVCHTEEELREAILNADPADYQRRLPYIEENRQRALRFANRQRNAALLLQAEDDLALSVA